jgi:hypothetical protein
MKTYKMTELNGVNSETSTDVSFFLKVSDDGSSSYCRVTECCGQEQIQEMQISRARALDLLEDWNVLPSSPEEN